MTKSKLSKKYKFDAYNQRDVLSLGALSDWTDEQKKIQKTHNRILQPGFMHRDASLVLEDAKTAKVDWITDVCCPSASAAIMLHIAKEMVTNYQVSETELDSEAHTVYASIVSDPSVLAAIEKEVDSQFNAKFSGAEAQQIEKAAIEMLKKNSGTKDATFSQDQIAAAKRLVEDSERRKILDPIASKIVKEHLNNQAKALGLTQKTRHPIGTTHDFAFLGAAGSGKSTITQQFVSNGPDTSGQEPKKIDKWDCVVLATDNYRAFTLPGTESHEAIATKDVFTRTQDIAYMVKELVLKEVEQSSAVGNRPNVICDCVKLEGPMRGFLAQTDKGSGTLVSKLAAYRGNPGYVGIAERVDARARNPDADPADKGRFVETTSLLKGHADASRYFLSNLPANAETEILDTDVDRDAGQTPVRIALVDGKNHKVEINNLRVMSEFLNKQNINIQAEHPVELILKGKTAESPSQLATSPENKAQSILALVSGEPPYSVILKDKKGTAYAALLPDDTGKVRMEVLDAAVFKDKISHATSPEAQVLRQITQKTAKATMEAAKGKAPESAEARAAKQAQSMLNEIKDIEYFEKTEESRSRKTADFMAKSSTKRETEESRQIATEEAAQTLREVSSQSAAKNASTQRETLENTRTNVEKQSLDMKTQLQTIKGENNYDVRTLRFTNAGFNKMSADCGFSDKFMENLKEAIQQKNTPEPDPINWIVKKYGEWIDTHPEDLPALEKTISDNNTSITPKSTALMQVAKVLQENAEKNAAAEVQMRL